MNSDWRSNLIEDPQDVTKVLEATRRIAVLGIKPEVAADQPSHYVPAYAAQRGFEIVPVPVYYPEVTTILGRKVYRKLADVAREVGPIDLIDVFRKPDALEAHVDDVLASKPKVVWLQSGIRNDAFAERLAKAGIQVVQDKCLLVELRNRADLVRLAR